MKTSTAKPLDLSVKNIEWFRERIGKEVHAEGLHFDNNVTIESESDAIYCHSTQGGKDQFRYNDTAGILYPTPTVGSEMIRLRFQQRI